MTAQANVKIVLNPAPVCALSDEMLQYVSIITPNKTEAQMLTGIVITDDASAEQAAHITGQRDRNGDSHSRFQSWYGPSSR
ncbi:MAG: PfkB family carbohydrate kinase [Ferruginibacter sp.]